ncbi:MAG: hypothetical protein GX894_02365 [Clostridia bacterium]|nr:hypothetical protein [Clostridia bacterium]
MNLRKIQQLLAAEILWGEEVLDQVEPLCACGSDLMSDVLAFTKEKTLLLTGLTNAQVIRTAEMIDLSGIIFVRGKRPPQEVITMAQERNLPLLMTKLPLYETCGILYSAGLEGCSGLSSRRR